LFARRPVPASVSATCDSSTCSATTCTWGWPGSIRCGFDGARVRGA